MRILLLSAYDTLSHRYWHQQLVEQFTEFTWTVLTLPPRFFNFRVRSNPVSWWLSEKERLKKNYDMVIATSMVDISVLRGLFPNLAATPLWLYCHENQFAYPTSLYQQKRLHTQQERNEQLPNQQELNQQNLEVKMVFFYGCLCADTISFNSHWNRNTAIAGLKNLFAMFPEKWDSQLLTSIEKKSDVLPVPISSPAVQNRLGIANVDSKNLQLVWNHRWEYDKGPAYLYAFVCALAASEIVCTLHIVGQQFRQQPEAFKQIAELFKGLDSESLTLGRWGFIEPVEEYQQLLKESDIVLSTALHDFQGVAILEAVQAGCIPLLPNQLVYPELFEPDFLYDWHDDPEQCAASIMVLLQFWQANGFPMRPSVIKRLIWPAMLEPYRQKMIEVSA